MDNYNILSDLGEGAFAKIYLGKHKFNDNLYAIKKINKNKVKIKHIISEAEILKYCNHHFIIKLYDQFENNNYFYHVIEYCKGGDLFNLLRLQVNHCVTEKQIIYYASCLLSAIQYLHSVGIIHRDLKIENILLKESGHIAITDYDLSILSSDTLITKSFINPYTNKEDVVTEPNILMKGVRGTMEYLTPEILNDVEYNCIIDWWAFGIIIYELLYGKTPFKECSHELIYYRINSGYFTLNNMTPKNEVVSEDINDLIIMLLQKECKDRLGYMGGGNEIKSHPFFKNVNFNTLYEEIPPITF